MNDTMPNMEQQIILSGEVLERFGGQIAAALDAFTRAFLPLVESVEVIADGLKPVYEMLEQKAAEEGMSVEAYVEYVGMLVRAEQFAERHRAMQLHAEQQAAVLSALFSAFKPD